MCTTNGAAVFRLYSETKPCVRRGRVRVWRQALDRKYRRVPERKGSHFLVEEWEAGQCSVRLKQGSSRALL